MFYRDNAALLCLFSHVSSCFHDRPSDNPHMLHSNKTSQFLLLASLPWQPDSFLEPTFLLAYLTQSRGRRPLFLLPSKSSLHHMDSCYSELSCAFLLAFWHVSKVGIYYLWLQISILRFLPANICH